MYFNYILICKANGFNRYESFKIKNNFYDSSGKCILSLEKQCCYSYFFRKCKTVTFLDFNETITIKAIEYTKIQKQKYARFGVFYVRQQELFCSMNMKLIVETKREQN